MSDEASEPVHDDDPPTWRKWIKWTATALLIGLPLLRIAWLFRPGDARHDIVVGPETTVVPGPLTPDGFIDFTAALNEQASAGVTPDNNAVVLLMQAYRPGIIPAEQRGQYFQLLGVPMPPDDGPYLLDDREFLAKQGIGDEQLAEHLFPLEDAEKEAGERPWTRDEFPRVAEMLDANRAPLELVSAAARRTRFYSPMTGPIFGNLLPVEQRMRVAQRNLLRRAMLHIGEGNATAASEDLLTCHRLARLTGQSPSIVGMLVAYSLESVAASGDERLIRSKLLTANEGRRILAELEALTSLPVAADIVDGPGRIESIDMIYGMASGSPDIANAADAPDRGQSAARFARAMDWNIVLKMLNTEVDRTVEGMRLPTAAERAAAFQQIEQERDQRKFRMDAAAWAVVGLSEPISREIGRVLVDLASPPFQIANSQLRADARQKLFRIGFALVIFERERGAYPVTLAELAPDIVPELPLDPCSGEPFKYERTDDGFLLHSIGENLKNEGGATYEDAPPGQRDRPDDIRIRVGDVPVEAPAAE